MTKLAARIENRVIVNIAVFAANDTLPDGYVDFVAGMLIGGGFDGTTVTPPPVIDRPPDQGQALIDATARANAIILQRAILAASNSLNDADLEEVAAIFDTWSPSAVNYRLNDVVLYEGQLYRVVQAHVSQADFFPNAVPALWTLFRDPSEGPQAWVQPLGAQDAYVLGELVTHDRPSQGGAIWIFESLLAANVEEPGRDGLFDRWWRPVSAA